MKIKTVDKEIKQNKTQYKLDRQTVKISALSIGNVGKYEYLTGQDVLPENNLLEKSVTIKIFEYLPLVSELKKQTGITKLKVNLLFADTMISKYLPEILSLQIKNI